ncbi:MAG: hypothetical protein U0807_18450 [Candidatus Binatia bacterium]
MKRTGLALTATTRVAAALLGLCVTIGVADAAEDVAGHAEHAQKVVHVAPNRIAPSDVELTKDDVLVFENHALYPMSITFTDPAEQADKIRCGLVHGAKEKAPAPWAVFTWDWKKRLTANVLPGRFASVCSFAPGQYSFVALRAGGTSVRPEAVSGDALKGNITVK